MTWQNGTIIGGPHNGKVVPNKSTGTSLVLPIPFSALAPRYAEQELKNAEYRWHTTTMYDKQGASVVYGFWLPREIEDKDAMAFILERAARR